MKLARKVGATSQIFQIFIRDSSSTTGAGLTGLTNASSSLTAYYHRDTDTTATAISLVTMTVGTFTSSGFKEIDATNMPGWYQFCPPNAALASGAASVGFHLKGATNMAPLPIEVDLDAQVDVTHWNGTAVTAPNTAGTPVVDVGRINNVSASSVTTVSANQGTTQPINFTGTGASALVKSDMVDVAGAAVSTSTAQIGVNAVQLGGTAQTGRDVGASVLLSSGTGTGQLDFTSGVVKANAVQWLGGTIPAVNVTGVPLVDAKYLLGTIFATPATAGIIDANVKNINNVAAATPGASGGVLISGSNSGTTTLAALTVTGSFTVSDGFLVSRSTLNSSAITATGNGTGSGAVFTSGAGATGDGLKAVAASTNGNGATLTHAGSGADLNATTTPLTLAKTTNITGFNDIAATAIVSAGAITTSGGKVSGVILTDTVTTYTGDTPQTGDAFARIGLAGAGLTNLGDTRIANLDTTVSSRMATYTQPTGFLAATFPATVASSTNITAGTITSVANVGTVATVTGLTVANLDTTVSSRLAPSGTLAVVTNVGTIAVYTGDTPQTGDAFARIGLAGAGLTNLGDTRIANLDTTVSSRIAPAGTLAVVTTAVNLTNAPTAGDFTSTMKTSLNAATPASVTGSVGSVTAAVTVDGTSSLTEAYASKGAGLTLASALYGLTQRMNASAIASTTMTVKKRDGTTTAQTFTLDSATSPASIAQAT